MDHIGKALEKAQARSSRARGNGTVRDWMQPQQNAPQVGVGAPQTGGDQPSSSGRIIKLDPERLKANRVIANTTETNPIVDRYRLLRTRLLQLMRPRGWNVVGITSPTAETGKTLTTINLATTLALAGNQTVYVVDADLRRPNVAHTLGFEPELGLIDFISQSASHEDVTYVPDTLPNLTIVPGRGQNTERKSSELLDSDQFARLIRTFSSGGERVTVLVDTPPILLGDDVLAAALAIDCFLMIVEEGRTTVDEIRDSARLLADHNLVGTVLNKSSEKPRRFESYYDARGERS